jgi:protease-4
MQYLGLIKKEEYMTKRARLIIGILLLASLVIGIALTVGLSVSALDGGGDSGISLGKKVGLVRIENVIESSEHIVDKIKEMRTNSSVLALVLRVNSPGGGVAASQEIYQEVKKFKESGKPVIVSMGSVAASGGYYVSCPADIIFANPGTLTGSIGVIFQIPLTEELMKKIGASWQIVKSGKFKDTGSMSRKLTDAERQLLQEVVDDTHKQFVEAIAEGRDVPYDSIARIADGRIFTGRQALNAHLVDTLGTFEDAITYAGEACNIEGEPKIYEPKKRALRDWRSYLSQGIMKLLLGSVADNSGISILRYQLQ